MAGFMDSSWRLGTGDLIQQLATLLWLNKGDDHKELLQKVTQTRVMYELYNRMSSQNDTDALQQQCILAIVAYIQKHPRATEAELTQEVVKQVELFKQQVATL